MNQEEAKKLIVDFFQRKGFCHAFVERQVATIESFPGKLKLEFSVLQGRPKLVLEIYVYDKGYDQSTLQRCLSDGWKPSNWERKDDKGNFGCDNGVVVRFFLPFDWKDSNAYDWNCLLNGYWEIRNRLLPCLAQSGSVQESFVAWMCEQKSQMDSSWSKSEADLRRRLTFGNKFRLNPFDCLKLLSGKNVLAGDKSSGAFDAVANFKKLSLKKDTSKQNDPEEVEINEAYLALFKEFCREYIAEGMTCEQWTELREKYAAEIARMRNSQYIIRAFEHTENKDFENYVVLGVWHRLRTLLKGDVPRPVTQQFVRHNDGHSFIDLYFPCVNIQVECDEGHHKSNIVGDWKRGKNIEETLVAIAEFEHSVLGISHNQNPILLRVDATLPLDDIDRQIDKVAGEISKQYGMLTEIERQNDWKKLSPVECVRSSQTLDVADGLVFAGRDDVLAALRIFRTSARKNDGVKKMDRCTVDWQAAPVPGAKEGSCRKGVIFVKIDDCLQGFQGLGIKDIVADLPFEYCLVFVRYRDALGVDGYRFAGAYGENGLCERCLKV